MAMQHAAASAALPPNAMLVGGDAAAALMEFTEFKASGGPPAGRRENGCVSNGPEGERVCPVVRALLGGGSINSARYVKSQPGSQQTSYVKSQPGHKQT